MAAAPLRDRFTGKEQGAAEKAAEAKRKAEEEAIAKRQRDVAKAKLLLAKSVKLIFYVSVVSN